MTEKKMTEQEIREAAIQAWFDVGNKVTILKPQPSQAGNISTRYTDPDYKENA